MRLFLICLLCVITMPTETFAQADVCDGAGHHLIARYAQSGDAQAQFQLSQDLAHDACSAENRTEALLWLHRAAAQNHSEASFLLGVRYLVGLDVTEDTARGLALLEQAAQGGHLEAQFQFAMIQLQSGTSPERHAQALYWLGAAAYQGETKAALALGHIYADGLHGIARHDCWASDWFTAAQILAQEAGIDVSALIPRDLRCDL